MAKVKYATGLTPLLNKHYGYVFQPNHTNQTMKSDSFGARSRLILQTQRQQGLMKAIRCWRNMTSATQTNWNTFAATYPQASRRNPAIFLTGYQLFLKRNHYLFLNFGIDTDFMTEPKLESLPAPMITFSVTQTDNCIDVSELYFSIFGAFPTVGSYILLRAFPMARDSGQFFEKIEQTILVEESFIDGFFVSLNFATGTPAVTISLYLSKVVYQSAAYVGTKVRYMGCFSPKTFLELTDTPDSYVDQAEKVVAVKADETGVEFVENGGGGISCADLPDCSEIIKINAQIEAISEIVSLGFNTSIPAIKYGLLYNGYCMRAAVISTIIVPGWSVWVYTEFLAWEAAIEAEPDQAGNLKSIGFEYWNSPNTGATNGFLFNGRGAGSRTAAGAYSSELIGGVWWIRTGESSYLTYMSLSYADQIINRGAHTANYGHSLRPRKLVTTLSDGESGIYIGNNGRIYRTICIKGVEILADNLAETKCNDGTSIPEISDGSAWAATSTPALCAFGNDWVNV